MTTKEIEAIKNLTDLEDEEDKFQFEPYQSTVFNPFAKPPQSKRRPQTVEVKRNRGTLSLSKENKRQQLKKQLKFLEETRFDYTPKAHTRAITSKSMACMVPLVTKYNGFPAHRVKKQPIDKYSHIKCAAVKENITPYYCINPEQQIRNDIMKKFKLRQSVRQTQKIAKISNFLKMANSPAVRNKAAPIIFSLNDAKFKRTLTNLLS